MAITITHDDGAVYTTECEVDISKSDDDTIVSKLIGPMQQRLNIDCVIYSLDQTRWEDK